MRINGHWVSLRKTEIIKVDDGLHRLPPDKGPFIEYAVADYPGCPAEWSRDGFFVAVKEGEPLWFDFRSNADSAVVCSVQRVNPITGEASDFEAGLRKDPKQNYLRLPEQMWLDGYVNDGKVYQFIVTKSGVGFGVNEFVLPIEKQDSHAVAFAFYSPVVDVPRQSGGVLRSSGICGQAVNMSAPTDPTWFSPLHTPQNWEAAVKISSKGSSKRCRVQNVSTSVNQGETLTSGGSCAGAAGSEVFYSNAIGASGDESRFTQNRVADNYNEVLEDATLDMDDVEVDKASMGMGGRISQIVTADRNTVEYYKPKPTGIITVYLALPDQFKLIMDKGKNGEQGNRDKHTYSGDLNGVKVPLVVQ